MSIGIIGLGRIGKMVADIAKKLGLNVYYYDPFVNIKKYKKITNLKLTSNKYLTITKWWIFCNQKRKI